MNWNVFDEIDSEDVLHGGMREPEVFLINEDPDHILPLNTPVHLVTMVGFQPMCWTSQKAGGYAGTRSDSAVTCPSCLTIIKEAE